MKKKFIRPQVVAKLRLVETLLLRTLQTRYHALGSKHPATFSTMKDLTILYRKQLLYNEVENLLIEAAKADASNSVTLINIQ